MRRPEETRHMPLLQESYRLVGVLLYSHNHHYIADVLDPDGSGWVRYDANSNGAIGWDVGAPTGRAQHEHHSYYAILLAYVRVRGCGAVPHAPNAVSFYGLYGFTNGDVSSRSTLEGTDIGPLPGNSVLHRQV